MASGIDGGYVCIFRSGWHASRRLLTTLKDGPLDKFNVFFRGSWKGKQRVSVEFKCVLKVVSVSIPFSYFHCVFFGLIVQDLPKWLDPEHHPQVWAPYPQASAVLVHLHSILGQIFLFVDTEKDASLSRVSNQNPNIHPTIVAVLLLQSFMFLSPTTCTHVPIFTVAIFRFVKSDFCCLITGSACRCTFFVRSDRVARP